MSGLIGELEACGSYVHIPRADRDYAIDVGLRMLTLRHLVLEEDGNYRANPDELILLGYYANAIVHLFEHAKPVRQRDCDLSRRSILPQVAQDGTCRACHRWGIPCDP